jgi:hypothetical protein
MQHKALFQGFPYDPLQIFSNGKTPVALYARRNWLRQHETAGWRTDFREVVHALLSGQRANGSWDNSLLHTVRKLFGLHLTVRQRNTHIEKGLEWLLSQEVFSEERRMPPVQSEKISIRDLQGLPFSGGCYDHFVKATTLFLAVIFGMENDSRVIHVYEMLRNIGGRRKGRWCTWSCSNNILRAFVVHPVYAESNAVRVYVQTLSEIQRYDGGWPGTIPFYQTVNALGHLDFPQSDALLKPAFRKLRLKQNRDGTWGRTQREWNTFLIVHALSRKRALL